MTNGGQKVTGMNVAPQGQLLKGDCLVNGVRVWFYYHPKSDKFTAASLLDSDAPLFGDVGNKHNWKYLVCGSIAHHLKTN